MQLIEQDVDQGGRPLERLGGGYRRNEGSEVGHDVASASLLLSCAPSAVLSCRSPDYRVTTPMQRAGDCPLGRFRQQGVLDVSDHCARRNSMIQFVSQVLPPSVLLACSKRNDVAVISDHFSLAITFLPSLSNSE